MIPHLGRAATSGIFGHFYADKYEPGSLKWLGWPLGQE
jgi:hypothetical protein